jgi:prepilin-type N-terminal cleavage/methylation domain-containing protein
MKTNPRRGIAAFTLIELMAVITIIVILAGLVVGGLGFVTERQAKERARVQLALLTKALEEYKLDIGMYPPTGNVTGNLGTNGSNNSQDIYIALFYEGYNFNSQTNPPFNWTKTVNGVQVPMATKIYLPDLDPTWSKQGWVDLVTGVNAVPPPAAVIKDPWGNQYCYRTAVDAAGVANANTQNPDFDLWSMGKDGRSNAGNPSLTSPAPPANLNVDDIRNF